jgi:hypothetical protein
MSRFEDVDGIDGPFEKAIAASILDDAQKPLAPIDAQIRRQMLAGARAVGLLMGLQQAGSLANCATANRDTIREIVNQWHGVPEPAHCRHPEKCAGKGSCPRDPVCID